MAQLRGPNRHSSVRDRRLQTPSLNFQFVVVVIVVVVVSVVSAACDAAARPNGSATWRKSTFLSTG